MRFNIFVLPFFLGLIFILSYVIRKFILWQSQLLVEDRQKIRKGFFSRRFLTASKEVFYESLLHRKMFRINPLMGYMHMSFALGWLLLIVVGNVESRLYNLKEINLPYYPIFLKFFVHDKGDIPYPKLFGATMDFLLLAINAGVLLALIKRINSRILGMKRTTQMETVDKIGLYSLWMIFPMRLMAESSSSAIYHNGGFLTGTLGHAFSGLPHIETINYGFWWAYSIALGTFFFALPFTRYMHIPTEVFLIYLRNFGVSYRNNREVMEQVDVHACSRCGVCIDACQLSHTIQANGMLPAHYFKAVREGKIKDKYTLECMMCGRCKEICPVAVETLEIRSAQREKIAPSFSEKRIFQQPIQPEFFEVAYFAGCMGHLTPSVIKSMKTVFQKAGVSFAFVDEEAGICCGRPQLLAGLNDIARELQMQNTERISKTGAKTLVTSCPICLNVFKKEYNLNIRVLHHTEFMAELAETGRLKIKGGTETFTYHEPCELSRGLGIRKEPAKLLSSLGNFRPLDESLGGFCCGGSLGGIQLSEKERSAVATDTALKLKKVNASQIVTACPLCKSTLKRNSDVQVRDVAELVAGQIV